MSLTTCATRVIVTVSQSWLAREVRIAGRLVQQNFERCRVIGAHPHEAHILLVCLR